MTNKTLFTDGNKLIEVQFVDAVQAARFTKEMMDIKYGISFVNSTKYASKLEKDRQYMQWLHQCRTFHSHWGDSMIFYDIRWAWNDVERGIGLPVTNFESSSKGSETGCFVFSINGLSPKR